MFIQTWLPPFLLLLTATVIAFPLGRYLAWIMDGKYRPLSVFRWFEKRLDSGPQNWKQYVGALLVFNIVLFVYGYVVLALQTVDAAESRRQGNALPQHHLSSRDLVHDEHGPPALGRRRAPVELQPDFLLHLHALHIGRRRILARWWRSSGPCAAIPRSAIISSTCGGYWSTCSCRSPL